MSDPAESGQEQRVPYYVRSLSTETPAEHIIGVALEDGREAGEARVEVQKRIARYLEATGWLHPDPTPDKEQTMGGECKIGGGTLEDYRRSAREVLNPGEHGEESLEWWADAVRCLCDEIERLRRGGEVEMHGEIRKKPWRWRVCAECHYSDWALDADYRVCNDCGSPRVTDYVPTAPTPTSEKERDDWFEAVCERCGDEFMSPKENPITFCAECLSADPHTRADGEEVLRKQARKADLIGNAVPAIRSYGIYLGRDPEGWPDPFWEEIADRVEDHLRTDPNGSERREVADEFLACPECRSALYRCGGYGDSGRPGTLTMCSECPWRGVLLADGDTIGRFSAPDREPVAWRWKYGSWGWTYTESEPELSDPGQAIIQPLYAPKEEGDG